MDGCSKMLVRYLQPPFPRELYLPKVVGRFRPFRVVPSSEILDAQMSLAAGGAQLLDFLEV
jgi:hypothetical protein